MFTLVGLMEFFYSEAPSGMRSLATSFSLLTISLGSFLSSVFVKIVEAITGRMASNGQGWLYGLDLNMNHLDRFYWLLALMSCVNFGVYVLCANWYKYRGTEHGGVGDDKEANGSCMQDLVKGNGEVVSEGEVKNQERDENVQGLVKGEQEGVVNGEVPRVREAEESDVVKSLWQDDEERT